MSDTNTGGTAFPQYAWNDISEKFTATEGMTLRDYFAAKALQGLLSDSNVKGRPDEFADRAYKVADAMLKARES